jgi:hypothetical protein
MNSPAMPMLLKDAVTKYGSLENVRKAINAGRAAREKSEDQTMKTSKSRTGGQSRSQAFDIHGIEPSGPRVADTGDDTLGRTFDSDGVMDRIAGAFGRKIGGDPDAIPNAGAGETYEDGIPVYRPQRFMPSGEGNDGRVGGEDRGVRPVSPNLGGPAGSYELEEDIQPGDAMAPVKLPGGMRIMNPSASGIADASPARFPDAATSVAKHERRVGIFKSVVFGARGDMADSFLSEDYDRAPPG